jgi:hypothetical protein
MQDSIVQWNTRAHLTNAGEYLKGYAIGLHDGAIAHVSDGVAQTAKDPQTAFNLGFRAAGGGCHLPPSAEALFQSWLRDGASQAGREPEEEIPAASPAQGAANPDAVEMYANALDAANARIAELEARAWPVAQAAPDTSLQKIQISPWQPIETAPKDGTEIIGLFHRRYDETTPPTIYGPWTIAYDGRKWRSSWDEQEVISYMSDFGTEYKGPDIEPTHWQPLPDTSTVSSTEGK